MFAEKEVGGGDLPLDVGFADIVEVDPASSDVFAGLSFGGTKAGQVEQFEEGESCAFEFRFVRVKGRHFADDIGEDVFGDVFQTATEQDFTGTGGVAGGVWAVDEVGGGPGQGGVSGARFGFGEVIRFQVGDFFRREEG